MTFFLGWNPNIFVTKFQNPMTTPSGRISNEPEERRGEKEKMPFIVATYVYASRQGQRTHSARTNNHYQ
jgi:hypothetical protein